MTVPSSIAKSGPYNCNGVTDVFNYDFRIVDKAHLDVILTDAAGVESALALTTHYTVSSVGSDTGSIALTTAGLALAVTGTKLTILRDPPFTQETDLQNQGAYYAETVEDRFDLSVMQIQTIKELAGRAVVVPASSGLDPLDYLQQELDDATDQAVARATSEADRATQEADRSDAGADRSEAARDIAAGYASDAVSQGNVPIYATVVGMAAISVPIGIDALRVNGYAASGDGGAALYKKVDVEPTHDLWFTSFDAAKWEIAEAAPSAAMAGAAADNATDDSAAMGRLIAWAMIDPVRRKARVDGRVYCTTDIADFHAVQWEGTGSIRVGTGPEFFIEPNKQNTGFGDLNYNVLYVDAAGAVGNSGLAPEFALPTIQAAIDVLKSKGSPVPGFWRISIAEGVYAANNTTIGLESLRGQRIVIEGVADAVWDNTDPPDDPVAITAITSANPPVVTAAGHGRSNGDKVFIGFAKRSGGAHASDGAIYTVAGSEADDTFQLSGVDGTGWPAYTTGGKVYDLTRSSPKTVIYGAGVGVNGIAFDGNISVDPRNLFFIGCGTKDGSADAAGILGTNYAFVTTTNCHYTDCKGAAFGRNDSEVYFVGGGKYYNCDSAFRAIHTRYTFGGANPSGYSTSDPIVKNCNFGVDVWEGATGHADGIIFIDNAIDMFARRSNSYIAEQYNRFTNTGAAKVGILINDGATITPGGATDTWTGIYKPRYAFKNGGRALDGTFSLAAGNPGAVFDWKVKRTHPDGLTITPGGGEATVFTFTLGKTVMSARPQQLRVGYVLTGTWTVGSVVLRLKLGADTLSTHTLPAAAEIRAVKAVIELTQNNFDTVRGEVSGWDKAGSVVSPIFNFLSVAFDTQAAAKDLILTAECVNAADNVTVQKAWLEGMGW